mmetsp:Transcript_34602/g.98827  ORF Transcript_34602/g.98827 Transcript_34602/m.98827 type:complete len:382 (+) Transcript_34602:694-1839(+)
MGPDLRAQPREDHRCEVEAPACDGRTQGVTHREQDLVCVASAEMLGPVVLNREVVEGDLLIRALTREELLDGPVVEARVRADVHTVQLCISCIQVPARQHVIPVCLPQRARDALVEVHVLAELRVEAGGPGHERVAGLLPEGEAAGQRIRAPERPRKLDKSLHESVEMLGLAHGVPVAMVDFRPPRRFSRSCSVERVFGAARELVELEHAAGRGAARPAHGLPPGGHLHMHRFARLCLLENRRRGRRARVLARQLHQRPVHRSAPSCVGSHGLRSLPVGVRGVPAEPADLVEEWRELSAPKVDRDRDAPPARGRSSCCPPPAQRGPRAPLQQREVGPAVELPSRLAAASAEAVVIHGRTVVNRRRRDLVQVQQEQAAQLRH